jgi:hypothetical protein
MFARRTRHGGENFTRVFFRHFRGTVVLSMINQPDGAILHEPVRDSIDLRTAAAQNSVDLRWRFTANQISYDLATHPKLGVPTNHRFSIHEIPLPLLQTLPSPLNFRDNVFKELLSLVQLRN